MPTRFPTTEDGYLKNTGSPELIQEEFWPLLQAIDHQVNKHLASNIASLYVRGSISAGEAYLRTSDADIVVLTHKEVLYSRLDWVAPAAEEILNKHPIVSDIDLTILPIDRFVSSKEYARLQVNLVTRSALLKGTDVIERLPRFKPDRALAVYMYPDVVGEFSDLRSIFNNSTTDRVYFGKNQPISFWCVWTMRTILRSAQALSMVTTGIYESELKACLDNSVALYPQLRRYLEQAYRWALNPTDLSYEVATFLDGYLPIFFSLWRTSGLG